MSSAMEISVKYSMRAYLLYDPATEEFWDEENVRWDPSFENAEVYISEDSCLGWRGSREDWIAHPVTRTIEDI
jgi:hypothetical protein